MYYFNLMHYPLEAVSINELNGKVFDCPNGDGAIPIMINETVSKSYCPIQSGNDILEGLQFDIDNRLPDMGIMIGWWVFMVIICYLSVRYIRHIKR